MTRFLMDSLSSSSSSSNIVTSRDAEAAIFGGDVFERLDDCDDCDDCDDDTSLGIFSDFRGDSVALQSAS